MATVILRSDIYGTGITGIMYFNLLVIRRNNSLPYNFPVASRRGASRFNGLPIDVGRHFRIPRLERRCDMCASAVGDEHHFVFHCEAFHPVPER